MGFVLTLHGELRWIVILLAVALIIKNTIGLVQQRPYSKLDRQLMVAYAIVLVINFFLGLILLFGLGGGVPIYRIEHAVTMLIAIAVAARASKWAKLDDFKKIYRNNLTVVILSVVLILIAIVRLPGDRLF